MGTFAVGARGIALQSHLELVSDREGAVEGMASIWKGSKSSEAAGREVCATANLVYLGPVTLLAPLET